MTFPSLRLGLSSGAFFPGLATEETVDAAARFGIQDMEVMLQTAGEYEPGFVRHVNQRARAAGVSVHSVHSLVQLHPVFDAYARRREEGWRLFERAVEAAGELGAKVLVWHGACHRGAEERVTSRHHLDSIDRLAGLCLKNGIALGLENVSWCLLAQTRDVLTLIAAIDDLEHARAVKFTFDAFQAAEAGANPFMVLAAMEQRLANVHLRDYRQSVPDSRNLLPGDGELPWPALIRAIGASGYDGPLILEGALEADDREAMDRVRRFLEPLIALQPAPSRVCEGRLPPGVIAGIELFNRGEYYECHEEIEHEWHAERGQIRRLYQGILQIGVGLHHARGGNKRGAVLLLSDGIAKVSEFLPECRGLDTQKLVEQSERCLAAISGPDEEAISHFDWDLAPRIDLPA
ncbi:MAG: DUF309 domain-containing protein [Thermomicrobiales bacterium]